MLLSFCLLLAVFLGGTNADAQENKFSLISRTETDELTKFAFADQPILNGSVAAPAQMLWDTSNVIPAEFADFGVFSEFRERYIGYIPEHRDRFEVRLYSGRIFPTRVALGAGYSALLASEWGKANFGVKTHGLTMGEVLGGDKSTGVMFVNRIATWRRGDSVFVMRVRFEAEHYDKFKEDIARLVGSWEFDDVLPQDPILQAMQPAQLDPSKTSQVPARPFTYTMPKHWKIENQGNLDAPGDSQIWIDQDDPNRNLAMLILALPAPRPVPATGAPDADEQAMIDLSGTIARLAIDTLLPDTEYQLKPLEMNAFGHLNDITAFNRNLTFTVPTSLGTELVVSVLLVQTKDGVTLSTVSIQPPMLDGYLMGTQNHGNFVAAQLLEAISAYAAASAARFQ